MLYIKFIFQLIGVFIVCGMFFYVRKKSSPSSNEWVVANWLSDMDVIAHGQRWQGSRSQCVQVLRAERKGFSTYIYEALCVTKSGRWFVMTAETHMALLTRWSLEPKTKIDVTYILELEEDEVEELLTELRWQEDEQTNQDKSSDRKRTGYKRQESEQD